LTGSVASEFGRRTLHRQHWGSVFESLLGMDVEMIWEYGIGVAPSKVPYIDNLACATCHELQARGRGS